LSLAAQGYLRTRPYPRRKGEKVDEYVSLLRQHKYMLIIDITGVPASALHEARKALRREGCVLKVVKNSLFRRALDVGGGERPELKPLKDYLEGQNAVLFTNKNPFSVLLLLRRGYRMVREAKPGDKATSDIVIPAGNTGIAPGPTLSLFNKLKVPIRIQEGSIWVTADTVVARRGEEISQELAELLGKLGLKPIEVTLEVKGVFVDGRMVRLEEVELEPEAYAERLKTAQGYALNLALNACLPLPEVMPLLVARAAAEAQALAFSVPLPVPGAIERALARAGAESQALYALLRREVPDL